MNITTMKEQDRLSIRPTINGFVLTHHTADPIAPKYVYQGRSEEKIEEMFAQAKLILLTMTEKEGDADTPDHPIN